ncbi:MAG: hypothetical protein KDK99_18395, partial [Verrucomicrobiales bacterium]|nr:hypothetical protein [Verrucomicrobiales bacterium]
QLTITGAGKVGNDFTCSVMGYSGHSYQLQTNDSLTGTWTNLGAPVAGTGITIDWTVTNGGIGDRRFYRVVVTP